MKRIVYALVAMIVLAIAAPGLQAQQQAKKQVAVYTTDSNVDDEYKKVISSKIVAKITQSPEYRALERTDEFLKALNRVGDFDQSGEVLESQIARVGRKLGVKYVAVVDISELLGALYVSARLIEVETNAIIATSEEYEGDLTLPNIIALAEKVGAALTSGGGLTSISSSSNSSSTPNGGQVERFTVNGVTFEMVKVDGGALTPFYIGKTEVTQKLWYAVMGSNPSNFIGDNNPVENVSWYDCQEFVERLSRLTGRNFRLPSEREWEYAAKGGNKSRGYTYSGSDDLYRVAWYTENSNNMTHPVGQKLDNELGIFDMSGNVWEWCSDCWDSSCSGRVYRGGGWGSSASNCRVSSRGYDSPSYRNDFIGLRLAL